MLCCGLCTLDELDAEEEKEKQMKTERAANEAVASSSTIPQIALKQSSDPFAKLDIPLLPPRV